jgi:hypothetical protein
MKVSYNWLKDFVEITESPQKLGDRFTSVGLAVDALEKTGDDAVFELDVATNRPDCLSHVGIAREIAAIYGSELKPPKAELHEASTPAADVFSISIADPDLCSVSAPSTTSPTSQTTSCLNSVNRFTHSTPIHSNGIRSLSGVQIWANKSRHWTASDAT